MRYGVTATVRKIIIDKELEGFGEELKACECMERREAGSDI